ncbi:hypothetical protein SEA_SKOG_203 [Gordonia phage Skog]|uniref:DUF7229 domain-containing protein n=1 Tax=Gordonia phage Skog TaxID=2704033 RepID=A0A6G6XKH4_9CAUD|nr:hypothetical protein KHQ85_gp203 [Gordonia phage Skog]QIG58355.1 hypothetical protein SEA_SKOG_203 [Gordonia phage Skog]
MGMPLFSDTSDQQPKAKPESEGAPATPVGEDDLAQAAREELARRADLVEKLTTEELVAMADIKPYFSTQDVSEFFDRSVQWVYWGLRKKTFLHNDGTPVEPERVGTRRRFSVQDLYAILTSMYQRNNFTESEMRRTFRRIKTAEMGGEWREKEGWHKIRGRYVHPADCVQDSEGNWVRRVPDDVEEVHR